LQDVQRDDGAFIPLWFGDQAAVTKEAPVYGSAVVLEHLRDVNAPPLSPAAQKMLHRTKAFLLASQHPTGGWGSCESERDYVTVTARCVAALQHDPDAQAAIERAWDFLRPFAENPETIPPEPIGLYFAHLWYSEELYAPIFMYGAIFRGR
jgi:squalene-hopene/tetraprenyl-beta-curcumene cyclase